MAKRRARMGRKRQKNKHFPRHLEIKAGWYYYVRSINGKRPWFALQTQDEAEALQRWSQLEAFFNNSLDFTAEKVIKFGDKKNITFIQLMDQYVKEVTSKKDPNTQDDEVRRADLLKKHFKNSPISKIEPLEISQYHKSLGDKPYEANRRLALLKHMFRLAVDPWGYLKVNPAREISKFPEGGIKLNLTEDILFHKIYPVADFDLRQAIMFAFHLVQHEDDVKNLKWSNINVEKEEIKFVRGKTGVEIVIHINKKLLAFIAFIKMRRHQQLSPWIISRWDGKKKKLQPYASFRSMWYRALTAAKCKPGDFVFKEIRNLANTVMKNEGVDADHRKALTGHKSIATNEKYTHPTARDSHAGSEALKGYGPKRF